MLATSKVSRIRKRAALLQAAWRTGPTTLDKVPLEAITALTKGNLLHFARVMDTFLPADLGNTEAAAICYAVKESQM